MDKPEEVKPGVYEHYKSTIEQRKLYQVLFVGQHTETEELLVVYVPLYNDPDLAGPRIFIRPLKMFTQYVKVKGQSVPRFKYLGEL